MGTRSMHIFPCVNKNEKWKTEDSKWIMQYLQFDGYPDYQIKKFIEDFKNRHDLNFSYRDFSIDKNYKEIFFEYLRAYYYLRSFDTYHSINNTQYVNRYSNKNIAESWCEYSYEWWSDDHPKSKCKVKESMIYLTITSVSQDTKLTISLKDLIDLCKNNNWDSDIVGNKISEDFFARFEE